ncbi:MAG: ATP-binding protein [Anaerolineales bacterium]|nr:ATP-binding protein [Anaerolineales bacterium]
MADKLDELVSKAEGIGVIGSPSSTTELALDIMARSVTKKLVGELAFFGYLQDSHRNYALGQITEIKLRNIWHEDPTMRSLIRQRGRVDAVSERQDTHQGEMIISAVFANEQGNYRPSILGTVPATGTPIYLADDGVLRELLAPYQSQIFYLGNVYGSQPMLPLWFKHFERGIEGAGESYHIGVFGKTGSGKSVLAKMIVLGYARHSQMGLFIFDPQGEFSLGLNNAQTKLSIGNVLHPNVLMGLGRKFEVYDLSRFRLGTWELLGELLLEFDLFAEMGVKSTDYQATSANYVVDFFKANNNKFKLKNLDDMAFVAMLDHIHSNIHRIYGGTSGIERVQSFIDEAKQKLGSSQFSPLKEKWDKVIRFFSEGEGKLSIDQIVQQALSIPKTGSRPLIVVDLSKKPSDITSGVWDEKIKPILIDAILGVLLRKAEDAYQNDVSLNTLVVLDEAHRLAPQERIANNERKQRIKTNLIDAVRTTRKYGLGWMFLSQTLSSLDNEIVQQLRISFFGFGLSMGAEYKKLQELVGGKGEYLKLYQQFRDPHSSFDIASREYSFMTIGPVSPLSFSGTPLFLNVFTDVNNFLKSNNIAIQRNLI